MDCNSKCYEVLLPSSWYWGQATCWPLAFSFCQLCHIIGINGRRHWYFQSRWHSPKWRSVDFRDWDFGKWHQWVMAQTWKDPFTIDMSHIMGRLQQNLDAVSSVRQCTKISVHDGKNFCAWWREQKFGWLWPLELQHSTSYLYKKNTKSYRKPCRLCYTEPRIDSLTNMYTAK